ncbi:hypothetical protein NliqN6_6386 [Naganishia liquefaciens]|uniref:NADH dehydrogenase [ubiquinone] 1 beta subcomplex subunit 11, mitochondrial n=1 Tax=Naganishia liquefaciens TaxID=104408 RepID=A0A8H3TZJ0_9TREE|nr:hypothetical protein NliqN6_6386 [Naganishia liquefaciens]
MLRSATSIARPLRSAANTTARRGYASHGPSYNAPSGYIFGEKPPPAGQKRVKEDWENIWYFGIFGGMAFAALILTYKPDTSIQGWAYNEAKRRMVESGQWEQIKYRPSEDSTIPASQ